MLPKVPPVFEALPTEVLGNILQQLASPEDLSSTIRASPNAFDSFRCFREAILIKVLQTHLPAEIFAEYLGLTNTPKYEDFNYVPEQSEFEGLLEQDESAGDEFSAWESCRYNAWSTVLQAFFQQHFANIQAAKLSEVQQYSTPLPADKHQINYIISMYGTLNRFIRDYQSFVRSSFTGNLPPLSNLDPSIRRQEIKLPQSWPPLKDVEALRLQRGFLRYELCSRLHAIPQWDWDTPTTPTAELLAEWMDDPCDLLSQILPGYLPRWEEEEIRCVWTYVYRQYQVLALGVVDEFRCDVRRLSRKARLAPDNEVILAPDLSSGQLGDSFEYWAFNMSHLGLPMLQQLLRSNFDNQLQFLKNTAFHLIPQSKGAITLLFNENSLAIECNSESALRDLGMASGVSHIYAPVIMNLWEWPTGTIRDLNKIRAAESALKDIGWIFWEDLTRLRYFGWPGSDNGINHYLRGLGYQLPIKRFEVKEKHPERSMYVTKEDFQGELSAKYPVSQPTGLGECFVFKRLRAISDWSSKEASTAFQEVCSGLSTSE